MMHSAYPHKYANVILKIGFIICIFHDFSFPEQYQLLKRIDLKRRTHTPCTPQKFNIDTKNDHMFKMSPPFPNHHFGYLAVSLGGAFKYVVFFTPTWGNDPI